MGLKPSSQIFTIGAKVTESAANAYTQQTIDLQLNPLDNEVLAIYAIDIQVGRPEFIDGVNTQVSASLSRNSRTSLAQLDEFDCLAITDMSIGAVAGIGGVLSETKSMADTPASSAIDYIGLVATSDMFFAIDGANNVNPKSARVKVWARRMVADSATYAALVASELRSN